jgi:hypothetical protein
MDALDGCPEAEGVALSFYTTSGTSKLTSERVLVIDIFPLPVIRSPFQIENSSDRAVVILTREPMRIFYTP